MTTQNNTWQKLSSESETVRLKYSKSSSKKSPLNNRVSIYTEMWINADRGALHRGYYAGYRPRIGSSGTCTPGVEDYPGPRLYRLLRAINKWP